MPLRRKINPTKASRIDQGFCSAGTAGPGGFPASLCAFHSEPQQPDAPPFVRLSLQQCKGACKIKGRLIISMSRPEITSLSFASVLCRY
jgi:hypothetical protein